MSSWEVDPNSGHNVSLSIVSVWKQFRNYSETNPQDNGEGSPGVSEVVRTGDIKHNLLRMVLGAHYVAPEIVRAVLAPRDGPAPTILDVGTGTGSWAIAMANEFPHAEVLGIDLVAPEPHVAIPPNCRFELDDVNLPLDHYANCFDVVHVRLVDMGIHDYPKFLNQVARMLRPGGIVLLVKAFQQLFSETCELLPSSEREPGFTYLQKICHSAYTAVKNRGGSEDAVMHYEFMLSENPNFEPNQTVAKDLFIPLGVWSTSPLDARSVKICEMMKLNYSFLIHVVKPLILKDGKDESEVDQWIIEAERELKAMSLKAYVKWRFAWAIRRKAPWIETES